MVKRPCLGCGTPTNGSRCAACQRPVDQAKWQRNANRDPAYRRLRAAVAARLPVPCALCGEPITHTGHGSTALTLDHIVPVSAGGSNDPTNLRPTHKRCNSARGAGR